MKKTLLAITCFFISISSLQAQTLYGGTPNGGVDGGGTLNKFIPATNNLTVARSFESFAANPGTNFIQATDGKLYGMTDGGGINNNGVIFSYDPLSSAYTILQNFDNINGAHPQGGLIQASDGKLYGMTISGGSSSNGVIFSYDPLSSVYTKLKDFDNINGARPQGNLIQATNGKLYGMTNQGGSIGTGVIFSFDPSTSTYTKLKDFGNTNGTYPSGSLVQASNGKLYGMTPGEGSSGFGVIFSFDPGTSTFTKLKDFDSTNGGNPYGSLIQASDGMLYGMTANGGGSGFGVIFSFVPSTSTYTKLKDFDSTNGGNPFNSLIQATDGKLYGMADMGGSGGAGVIFSFNPTSSTYSKLKDFDKVIGTNSHGNLTQATDGKLYGMTHDGGFAGVGIIFSFDPSNATYTKLRNFNANGFGSSVSASLMQAGNGNLYGMTTRGGAGYGVIFSFDPFSSTYTSLKNFDNTDGGNPSGSLIQASNGKLYGMTPVGGNYGIGVIFSLDPSTSTFTKLRDFDSTTGANPYGSLLQASDGKLYGMTNVGGIRGYGVIFSFDPSTSAYTELLDFTNGASPYGSLIQASDGKLYGMTSTGLGSPYGVIFSFDPASSDFRELPFDFITNAPNGSSPFGSLIQASNGRLYGMTNTGGTSGKGIIFSFDPSSFSYTKLKDLDSANGANPGGNFLQASDGKLYGMTTNGGSTNVGVIFSFDPASSTYTKLEDFDFTNGANPAIGAAFIEVTTSALPVTLISFTGKNIGNNNLLSWKVQNEQNLNYYELQRSTDGQNFNGISQIKAVGNNSYSYNDPISAAISSIYYYRLKSVDKDANFKYSTEIKLRRDINGFAVVNPNPFKDQLVVTIESLIQNKATLILTDLTGRELFKENKLLSPGSNVVEINETDRLSKGTYLLTIIESQQTQTIKVIKGN